MTTDVLGPVAPRHRTAVTALLGALVALSVPFVVTGLFRLDLADNVVAGVCLAAALALAAVPVRGRVLMLCWLAGCVVWVGTLFWIMGTFSAGLEGL